MAYDEGLAQRVREALGDRSDVVEKRMFGGVAFMVRGHMALGVAKDDLMVRLAPDEQERALKAQDNGVRPMDFTGRSMKGFLFVGPAGVETDDALADWVERAVAHATRLPPKRGAARGAPRPRGRPEA